MDREYEKKDGLTCLTESPENTQIHLIFVHGLNGGAYSTWDSGNQSELGFWPNAIAKKYSWCCVWTLHYTADILEYPWAPSKTIDLLHKSNWLMSELVLNRIHEKPVVFICHSLGGILVKQALQFSQFYGDDNWRLIWRHTQAVIFLATPHVGAGIANIAIAISNAIRSKISWPARSLLKPSKALKNLERNNPTLIYLKNWYRNHAPVQGIKTIAFAEGKPVGPFVVVNVEDANPQVAFSPLIQLSDKDHISIAKPENSNDTVYKQVTFYLEELKKKVDEGRIQTFASPGSNVSILESEKEAMEKLAKERKWVSYLSGYWWEFIEVDDKNEISFFQIQPHAISSRLSCWGNHFDMNGIQISEWKSITAGIEKENDELILKYHWEGYRIKGNDKGSRFSGFGNMKFNMQNKSVDRIDRGGGEFWDVNESHPEQTVCKSIKLRRVIDSESIRIMEDGTDKEIKSLVVKRLS